MAGGLICSVSRPDEKVVHPGSMDGKNTIIWQRHQNNPLKMEYFRETIIGDRYNIIGWGFYGEDNPNKNPRYWFYASYQRKRSETQSIKRAMIK